MKLDAFDQKIIALLVDDARLSVSEISRFVSLSRSAVAERIKRLEDNRIITGYHAKLADEGGAKVSAFFAMTFSPLICEQVLPYLAKYPEVKLAHSISGGVDLMLFVEADSMARLNSIRESFEQWPNLKKVVTHTSLITRLDRR